VRYLLLDLVRAVAIILLMTAHSAQSVGCWIGKAFGVQGFYYVTIGGISVTIFLVLSGLLLGLLYQDRKIGWFDFMAIRVIRLYPVYYMAVLFAGIPIYFFAAHYSGSLSEAIHALRPSDIILTISGLYSVVGKYGGPFVGTAWFIGVIMSMYMMYPPIAWCMRKNPHLTVISLLTVSVVFRLALGDYQNIPSRPLDCFPLCRVGEFTFGVYLAHVVRRDFWLVLNKTSQFEGIITFISELSFPLFLVHSPLRFIIRFMTDHGAGKPLALAVFLIISILFSWALLIADEKIPRQRILGGLLRT